MPRVQRLTLKQVQMLTPEQINKMTDSERARALTTVQDVLAKRQKRASQAGVKELPGLKNYEFKSTRGMNKEELKQQLKFAVQASKNSTSTLSGFRKLQDDTYERIKSYMEPETETEEDEEDEEENPLLDKEFRDEFWKIYDKVKEKSQGFGTDKSWTSDTLQSYIMERKQEGKSYLSVVRSGRKIAKEKYLQAQAEEKETEKEMEPEYHGENPHPIEIDGNTPIFDI
jgi:hypothetical protein